MLVSISRACFELLRFEIYLCRDDFRGLYGHVKDCPVEKYYNPPADPQPIVRSVNLACAFYFKKVLCLQRAAVTTCLLRKAGIAAQLVIGVQTLPYGAHAWVEVDGNVVNDKSYTPQMYSPLSRC